MVHRIHAQALEWVLPEHPSDQTLTELHAQSVKMVSNIEELRLMLLNFEQVQNVDRRWLAELRAALPALPLPVVLYVRSGIPPSLRETLDQTMSGVPIIENLTLLQRHIVAAGRI